MSFNIEQYNKFQPYTFDSSPIVQNGRHLANGIFKCIFMNEKFCIFIQMPLQLVPKGSINNTSLSV